jgi:peptidoglycan/LPS O-acetylase OafA/YrhL/O-antigen/teichoic acid export membrane protein
VTRATHPRPPSAASPAEALRRLFGRGSIYTLVLAIQMSVGLLVLPVVTRLLSPAAYGRVAAGLVVLLVISVVGAAGLPEAASRAYFTESDGHRAAHRLIVATLFIAVAVALVLELTGTEWAPLLGVRYPGVLRLAVWGGAAGSVMLGTQTLLRVMDRVWAFLSVSLLASVGGQGIGLGLTIAFRTPTAYMAGLVIGTGLAVVLGLALTGALRCGVPKLRELQRGLRMGAPFVPHSLASYLVASADRVAILAVLGLAAAGRYQVAYAIGGIGIALAIALNQAWLPLLLGTAEERRWEILTATSRSVHLIAAFVAATIALSAPLALLVAVPGSYGRAALVPVSAIVAFSVLPYVTGATYSQVLFLTGKTRLFALAAPLAAVVNIALNIALLPVIGLVGAAVATVVAYAVLPAVFAPAAFRIVALSAALRDALCAWLIATPFVIAGALLPATPVGVTLRIAAGLIAVACATRVLVSAMRGPRRAAASATARVANTNTPVADTSVLVAGASGAREISDATLSTVADLRTETTTAGIHRLRFLDGIRGLAAVYVVISHIWDTAFATRPPSQAHLRELTAFLGFGRYAVAVFIVVSGFSLGLGAWKGELSWPGGTRTYIRRRVRRIWPPYAVAVLLSSLMAATLLSGNGGAFYDQVNNIRVGGVLTHLAMIQDLYWAGPAGSSAFWSIPIEFDIYFFFLLVLALTRRWRRTPYVLVAGLMLLTAVTLEGSKVALLGWIGGLYPSLYCLFLLGFLGAASAVRGAPFISWVWRRLLLAVMLGGIVLIVVCRAKYTALGPLTDFIVGPIVAFAITQLVAGRMLSLQRQLTRRLVVWVGDCSYSLYLTHAVVIEVVWRAAVTHLSDDVLTRLVLELVLGVPLAVLVARLFYLACERPFMRSQVARSRRAFGVQLFVPAVRQASGARAESRGARVG